MVDLSILKPVAVMTVNTTINHRNSVKIVKQDGHFLKGESKMDRIIDIWGYKDLSVFERFEWILMWIFRIPNDAAIARHMANHMDFERRFEEYLDSGAWKKDHGIE